MNDAPDFPALIAAGMRLQTRDRRSVADLRLAGDRILGRVPMLGEIAWRKDGRYAEAPGNAAGPLDLVLPPVAAATAPRQASLQEALAEADPAAKAACCD